MHVLTLASQKGGSGKTTLAGHIAVQAQRAGAGPVAALGLQPRQRAAQEVARAPDLQVAHGDAEAGAELGGLADGLEPLVRVLAERHVPGVEQVGVRPLPGPADAAAHRLELAEAEAAGLAVVVLPLGTTVAVATFAVADRYSRPIE